MAFSKLALYGTNHLFGIGINKYQHLSELYNAKKDVADFITLMVTHFDFEKEDVITLFNEKATQTNILNTLKKIAHTIKEDDNLIIYFRDTGLLIKPSIKNIGFLWKEEVGNIATIFPTQV